MHLLTMCLLSSFLIMVTSGWGDVIYYPEFIKYMGKIGGDKEDISRNHQPVNRKNIKIISPYTTRWFGLG